jgi:hypothetical protein
MNEMPPSSTNLAEAAAANAGGPVPAGRLPQKRQLSYTQLNMFLRCPRQYEYRYVRGLKVPPSGAMVQSRVWHQTVEFNYRQKIHSDRDLALGEMQEFFVTEFDAALASEEVAFEPGEKPGKLKDQGTAIVAAHHRTIAPAVRPLLVEERFTVNLGEDFPFDLVGVWDVIERDGTITDNKAYSKTPQQEGKTFGDHPMRKCHIYTMLANPLYAARIRAADEIVAATHPNKITIFKSATYGRPQFHTRTGMRAARTELSASRRVCR